MRILIASKRAPDRPGRRNGGVQTWVATVAAELRRLGHEVEIGDALIRPAGRFDLGILSNWPHVERMAEQCERVIPICHGIVPDERPGPWSRFTSEEVRSHWHGCGSIIRQPLDLSFWSPGTGERSGMLRYSPRVGLDFLPAVAARLGMSFHHLRAATPTQAREAMRSAAVVLASGRAAVEAAACGAAVVICDDRSYQGPLLDWDTLGAMAWNYSGRGGTVPDAESVANAANAALYRGSIRWHVEMHHDVRQVVQQLLA